jgi:hypothetical protein
MFIVPQSTALRVALKAYLSSDHVTEATGKTLAVVISKNGGAFGNPSAGATNATEIANGWYYVDLSTTDTNTLGPLIVRATAASVDSVEILFRTVDAATGGATNLAATISSRTKPADTQAAVTTVTNLTNAPTSGDLTATMKTSVTTAASSATPAVTVSDKTGFSLSTAGILAIWHQLTAAIVTASTIGKLLVDNIDAAISSRNATTPPTVAAIRAEMDANSTKLANLDATISSRTKPADTQARVTLVDTVTTLTGNTVQTGDSYARIGAAGAGLTALGDTRIANLDAAVSTRSTYAGADTAGTTTLLSRLTATRAGLLDNLDTAVSGVAAAVWAVATRTLSTYGTLVADVTAAVWGAASRTLTAFGFTVTATADPDTAAIKAKTDNLPASPAAVGSAMTLTGAYDAAKTAAQAGALATVGSDVTTLLADVEALPDAPTATANADALLGRNIAGGSNGGRTVKDALRVSRNKVVVSATTITVYAEDDTTIAWTGTLTTDAAAIPITAVAPQ